MSPDTHAACYLHGGTYKEAGTIGQDGDPNPSSKEFHVPVPSTGKEVVIEIKTKHTLCGDAGIAVYIQREGLSNTIAIPDIEPNSSVLVKGALPEMPDINLVLLHGDSHSLRKTITKERITVLDVSKPPLQSEPRI